jgi:hypothetical protein
VRWFEAVSNLFLGLAWPIIIGILIIVLRKQLKQTVDAVNKRVEHITEVRAAGVTVKLRELREQQAKQIAERTEPFKESAEARMGQFSGGGQLSATVRPSSIVSAGVVGPPTFRAESKTIHRRLAEEDPRAAILLTYIELERFITDVYKKAFPDDKTEPNLLQMIDSLVETKKVLPSNFHDIVRQLYSLRSEVLHGKSDEVSADTAKLYRDAVVNLMRYMLLSRPPDEKKDGAGEDKT